MRQTILIGGKAGQGINKISEIISRVFKNLGYYTFNYRDYQSLIRGGHNFNVLSISDMRISSTERFIDVLIALDDETIDLHKKDLKKNGILIGHANFEEYGKDSNIAQASAYLKIMGVPKEEIIKELKKEFKHDFIKAVEVGYNSQEAKSQFFKLKNRTEILTGSKAVAIGAVNSGVDLYFAYPMTPATGVMNELAIFEKEKKIRIFQPENETAGINQAIGASFAGKQVMIGTAGGGFDLMTEGLSMIGVSEIPLTIYLASRPGPATGVPTYSSQADLNIALYAGHGDFSRVVVAPGNVKECIEKTNEAIYLAEKFKIPSIILSDKHLAESEFSFSTKVDKPLRIKLNRDIPGNGIVKATSYEHDEKGNTVEDAFTIERECLKRNIKEDNLKKFLFKLQTYKVYGDKNSNNVIVSFGSTKGVILDAITDLAKEGKKFKFVQILYLKPFPFVVLKELTGNLTVIEQTSSEQFANLLRQQGINNFKIITKFDGRPFFLDELKSKL